MVNEIILKLVFKIYFWESNKFGYWPPKPQNPVIFSVMCQKLNLTIFKRSLLYTSYCRQI